MKRTILTAIALTAAHAAALSQTADAPAAPQSGKWTLQECIDYALANNVEMKQTALSIEDSQSSVDQSKGSLFPTLSFSTSHNLNWRPWSKSTVNLSGGTLTTTSSDVSYHGSYGLNASWTIWDGGKKYKNVDVAQASAEQSELSREQTANSIEEQIAQLYVQILYQGEAVVVADSALRLSLLQRDRGKAMVEAGKMAKVDLAQLEAQVSQDEYSKVSASAQLSNYKLQLKQVLEITGSVDFDVATPEVSDEAVLAPLPNKDDVYAAALETRPEMKSGALSVEQAELQENIARRGAYPTIGMSAGISTSHSSASDDAIGEQIKQNVNNSVGLSVSVPILDGRSTRTSKAKAKIQKQQSELQLVASQKNLYKQIETCWLNAFSAQSQYVAAKSNVQRMQESYDLVSEQFRLGLKNIAELTAGKNNLLQAQQQLLQCKYTALLDIALLRFYAGEDMRL